MPAGENGLAARRSELGIAATLAKVGLAMTALPWPLLGEALAGAVAFALIVDVVKLPVFKRLGIG